MKFEIRNRWSGEIQVTAEIDCPEDAPSSIKLGLAIKWAVSAGANLAGANLAGANLAGAYLAGANLAGAYLAGANLAGANLADANLAGAYLARANLAGANLADANLAGAYLAGANLAGAYLAGANLAGANLAGANLADANLADAYLARAKIRDGITITKAPIGVYGLAWPVLIYDQHMQIGCEFHSHDEWRGFGDQDWLRMGGKEALHLKYQQFPALIMLCDQHRPENDAEDAGKATEKTAEKTGAA